MNLEIIGQKINIVKEAKYLCLQQEQHLMFKQHTHSIKLTLNTANTLLIKIR